MRAAAILGLLVAGCVTPATKTVCLPLTPYTAAEQAQAASELQAATQFPELSQMVRDYGAVRDADRACVAAKP